MNPCHALRYLTILLLLVPLVACGDANSSDDPHGLTGWNVTENQEEEQECPGADEGYYYMGSTLEECAAVDYICEAPLQDFANECGCGCVSTSGSEPEPGPEPGPGPECPDEDDGYHYISTSPTECAAIDFVCDPGYEPFENQCGCGCKEFLGICLYPDDAPQYDGYDSETCIAVAEECTEGAYYQDTCGCRCDEIGPMPILCPAEEDGYEYVSHDYSECMVIFYSCDEDQQYFEDTDCGCGCYTPPSSGGSCEPIQPMDAQGDGLCDAFFGWTYTGDDGPNNGCHGVSGCDCVGADCGNLFQDLDECIAASACS